jgi:hypothetical protein
MLAACCHENSLDLLAAFFRNWKIFFFEDLLAALATDKCSMHRFTQKSMECII